MHVSQGLTILQSLAAASLAQLISLYRDTNIPASVHNFNNTVLKYKYIYELYNQLD